MYKKTVMSITFVTIFAITIPTWQRVRTGRNLIDQAAEREARYNAPKKFSHAVTKVIDIPLWVI
jgi:hypothetical protein